MRQMMKERAERGEVTVEDANAMAGTNMWSSAGEELTPVLLNPDWVDMLMGYPPGYTDPHAAGVEYKGHDHRWPAGFGVASHDHEPPRSVDRTMPKPVRSAMEARLKMLGNSIVPQVAQTLFEAILAVEDANNQKGGGV